MPSVALVTEAFWPQAEFVARSLGMPDAPRVQLPHPLSGTGGASLRAAADAAADAVLTALRGNP